MQGHTSWAYVTAHNPRSVPLPSEENRARHRRLEAEVRARGFAAFVGQSVGDDGTWPPETSLLILGISRSEAVALGFTHGQRAVVWGALGEPARLLFCPESPAVP